MGLTHYIPKSLEWTEPSKIDEFQKAQTPFGWLTINRLKPGEYVTYNEINKEEGRFDTADRARHALETWWLATLKECLHVSIRGKNAD